MVPNFEIDGLRIEVSASGLDRGEREGVRLDWFGRSNGRYPAKVLDPYLHELVAQCATDDRRVEMHFERLEYFNSSTVSALIRFIRLVKEKNVRLRLVYNDRTSWQKLSFDSLSVFADGELLVIVSDAEVSPAA